MKKLIRNTLGFIALLGIITLTSCEGPAGPAGMNGETGCTECHTKSNFDLKKSEYATSGHGIGANVGYAGGRNSCAKCHSNEGFIETQHTGMDTTAANIPIATAIGCATCHSGHVSFDAETDGLDYALRTTEAVDLIMFSVPQKVDLSGSSNLCANCHQPRRSGPVADANGNFKITSTHWGPHHGPQATYLKGVGAYEVSGSEAYPTPASTTHFTGGACVACHMGESTADGGGHTFSPNVAACTTCHTSATSFDVGGVQTEVAALLHELEELLQTAGVLDAEGHVIPATYTVDLAGAYYNYIGIEEDRSLGVHNPAYIKAVLKNTIAKIK